jgi:hypothetical protein
MCRAVSDSRTRESRGVQQSLPYNEMRYQGVRGQPPARRMHHDTAGVGVGRVVHARPLDTLVEATP